MNLGFVPAFLVILLAMGLSNPVSAGGVAVTKEQSYHSDASAKPFVYTSVVDSGRILAFTVGTKRFNIERTTFVAYVAVPSSIPDEIVSNEQIDSLRTNINEIKEFSKRFSKASPILEKNLISLQKILAKIDAGEVRVQGVWLPRKEHEANVAEAKAKSKEIVRISREKSEEWQSERRAFIAEQQGKGLVKYGGEWVSSSDAEQRRANDMINFQVLKLLQDRSIKNCVYKILQNHEKGVICSIRSGESSTAMTDYCYVYDIILTAQDEWYKSDLYYSGTYSYQNKAGDTRTVASYCINKNTAVKYLRAIFEGSEDSGEKGDSPDVRPKVAIKSPLPDVLAFATSFGSGFFVGNSGYVITNYHVVMGCKNVRVFHENKIVEAKIIAVSAVSDLAILATKLPVDGLPVSDKEHESGDEIFALGFPLPSIQGTELKMTKGIISSATGIHNDASRYQIDAAIQPGNSGGPICDSNGKVLGVVVSKLDELSIAQDTGSITQNVNYAIKSTEVLALLRSKGIELEKISEKNFSLKDAKSASCLIATD